MSGTDPGVPDEDGGRQFERTALAHLRTMLAAALVGLLIVRESGEGVERVVAITGAVVGVLGAVAAGFARHEALHRRSVAGGQAVVAIVAAVGLLQVVALVVVL